MSEGTNIMTLKKNDSAGYPRLSPKKIKLVVFDLAGTTVDHGCIAPVAAFVNGFKEFGVDISIEQARAPMGMEKRAHIRAIGEMADVASQWLSVHGRGLEETDIDAMYHAFVPGLLTVLPENSELIPGTISCVQELEQRDIRVAATTGYFREATAIVLEQTAKAGFIPQASCCATEVPEGRPAPWMIYHCMQALGVYPAQCVVNVGDTPVDVESGCNAGVWSIGVTASGNAVGLTEKELAELDTSARKDLVKAAEHELLAAGGHYAIDTIADLPEIINDIEQRLARGETP